MDFLFLNTGRVNVLSAELQPFSTVYQFLMVYFFIVFLFSVFSFTLFSVVTDFQLACFQINLVDTKWSSNYIRKTKRSHGLFLSPTQITSFFLYLIIIYCGDTIGKVVKLIIRDMNFSQ